MCKIIQANLFLYSVFSTILMSVLLFVAFPLFEPILGSAAFHTDEFVITQTISGELSFATSANDVTMDTVINGITGGSSFGTSTVVVRTNNPLGYNLSMMFASTTAMIHNSASGTIPNYPPSVVGIPDFAWSLAANTAGFGYSVVSTDADTRFNDDGAVCNTGAGNDSGVCWYGTSDAETDVTLSNRTTATIGVGATTTIIFQIGVEPNPSISVPTGTYSATATLTLVDNT